MALVRGCGRCGTGYPTVTTVRTPVGPVDVRLCDPCREQAGAENAAAAARVSGGPVHPGRPFFAGEDGPHAS